MKKTVSMIIVLLVCFCFCSAAYAEGECFTVTYTGSGSFTVPNETLDFEVEAANGSNIHPSEMISVEDQPITESVTEVPIVMPTSYRSAGEYVYEIRQNAGSSPYFNYDTQPIEFHVLVGYDYDNLLTVLATGVGYSGNAKKTGFTNTLKTGSLSVTNLVQGRAEDRIDGFDIKITFEGQNVPAVINYTILNADQTSSTGTSEGAGGQARTVKIKLTHGSTATFNDMPAGISYTVEQDTLGGFNTPVIDLPTGNIAAGESVSVNVKNSASVSIGSGVLFENTGTLIILAVAVIGLLLLLIRKKKI